MFYRVNGNLNSMPSLTSSTLDRFAKQYVQLVLAVGVHDPDYVDAFYGPADWRGKVESEKLSLPEIHAQAESLISELGTSPGGSSLEDMRHRYLVTQTLSVAKYVEMLQGARFSFDEESKALYDAVAPVVSESHYQDALATLESVVPGSGNLAERYAEWQQQFFIPSDKLSQVFSAAVEEARVRTKKHIQLPENESFEIEYVTGQPWGAYNWYKGNSYSLIQVNVDFPIRIGNAVSLAAHEGYPGHHVYNALLEDRLAKGRGWVEFMVYPLFSPQSLIAEGTAEYGVDLVFPPSERNEFMKHELFPLAGIDSAKAEEYREVYAAFNALSSAGNQAARNYLDGNWSKDEFVAWHVKYLLVSPERAEKSLRFIEKNRSYIINYDLGKEMIVDYMERQGAPLSEPEKAWPIFEALMSSPILPSGLI